VVLLGDPRPDLDLVTDPSVMVSSLQSWRQIHRELLGRADITEFGEARGTILDECREWAIEFDPQDAAGSSVMMSFSIRSLICCFRLR
jgi:hypothetical protein